MKDFTNADVGTFGENECLKYIKKVKKYKVIGTNLTIKHLEADIVAYDDEHIIFIEVKTRREDKNNFLRPGAAVNQAKRNNLIRFAYSFVKTLPAKFQDKTPRIDVCEITVVAEQNLKVCSLNYIENAVTR